MSYYSENGGLLYRSYLPGRLRKRSTFRDQLVIPSACIPMVLHACHDYAMSGGHLAYKHTFIKVHDIFWWPTLHHDVKTWCQDCQACQRRKTPHRRAKLPTGHLPVDRPFRRVSIDLVEYKTESVSPTELKCSYALTIIDNLTRFAVLVALRTRKSRPLRKLLSKGYLVSSDRPRYSIPIKVWSSRSSCRTSLITRKAKRRPLFRKATRRRSVYIRPYMPCFRCTAILHRTIGLRPYRSYSSLTIRLLARLCIKRRSS